MEDLNKKVLKSDTLIFTDGASKGNPGPGGWGVAIIFPNQEVLELGGRLEIATNNQMELTAVIEALRIVVARSGSYQLYSDSTYVLKGIQQWLPGWRRNAWLTKEGTTIANLVLWQELDALLSKVSKVSKVQWLHLPGHAGIPGNERVDCIADAFASNQAITLYHGSLSAYGIDPFDFRSDPRQLAAKKSQGKKAYSYVSMVDGKIERHQSWAECQARVLGKSGAKFKKSLDSADEAAIILSWNSTNNLSDL